MLCRYGKACRNPNCQFIHPDISRYDTSKIPCEYHLRGRCNKGANCKFLHDPTSVLESEEKPTTPVASSSPISKPEPEKEIIEEEQESEIESEREGDEDSEASVEEIRLNDAEIEQEVEGTEPEVEEIDAKEESEDVGARSHHSAEQEVPETVQDEVQIEPEKPTLMEETPPETAPEQPIEPQMTSSTTVVLLPARYPPPSDAPKIIPLPTRSNLPQKGQMQRQSRSMADIKIKTLEQIKKEKEEMKRQSAAQEGSPATTPSKATMMQRVTRTTGKNKGAEVMQEPSPVKKPKITQEIMEISEEMQAKDMERAENDQRNEMLYEEIVSSMEMERKEMEGVEERGEGVETAHVVFSPGLLLVNQEIEAGEVVESPPPQPSIPEIPPENPSEIPPNLPLPEIPPAQPIPEIHSVVSNPIPEIEPTSTISDAIQPSKSVPEPIQYSKSLPETLPEIQPSKSFPETIPAKSVALPPLPEINKKEPAKPLPSTTTNSKTVIPLPAASKPKGAGEILTLEQIRERKKQKAAAEEAAKATKSQPAVVSPVQKRPREAEIPTPEPVKRAKPIPKPVPSSISGDWEPLAAAFKSLDFSTVSESGEDVSAMQDLAVRMSTPNGFLELLEELEEKVTERELAKGISPAIDPDFLILSLEDQINWLYMHTSDLSHSI